MHTTQIIKTNSNSGTISKIRLASRSKGLREIIIVLSVYVAYSLTQGNLVAKESLAFHNANSIINLERYLKIYWELTFQSWFISYNYLIRLANAAYTYLFYPVMVAFAIWAYNRHQLQYKIVRNIFLFSAAIGLLGFAFFPTAPPRLMPGIGFVDTLAKYEPLHYTSMPSWWVNQYAAMPSFHFSWMLLIGVATTFIARTWWLKLLGILLPFIMLVSIIATGNHFILDAVAGGVVMVLAYALNLLFLRLRNKYPTQAENIGKKVSG